MKPMNSSDSKFAIMARVSGLTEAQERTIAALPEDQREYARAICLEAKSNGGNFELAQEVVDTTQDLGVAIDAVLIQSGFEGIGTVGTLDPKFAAAVASDGAVVTEKLLDSVAQLAKGTAEMSADDVMKSSLGGTQVSVGVAP